MVLRRLDSVNEAEARKGRRGASFEVVGVRTRSCAYGEPETTTSVTEAVTSGTAS